MSNTGYKAYQNRRRLVNGVPDGFIEPNSPIGGIGSYIPPIYDVIACPLPTTTTTTESPTCIKPILISIGIDGGDNLLIVFSNNGGNPSAITVEYSTNGVVFGNPNTGSPSSPRNIGLASTYPPQNLYFRLKAECSEEVSSGWSNILQYNNTGTPPHIDNYICNLTNQVVAPGGMCSPGGIYTTTLYTNGDPIAPGTQLYYDAALTMPVVNMNWVKWNGNNTIWQLDSNGLILTSGSLICPI